MIRFTLRLLFVSAGFTLLLAACSDSTPVYYESDNPLRLSAWNLFELNSDELEPVAASMVFRPRNQLFTDYAHKLRTLWIPTGTELNLVNDEFEYPVGTVFSKTFYYPLNAAGDAEKQTDLGANKIDLNSNQLIETRLLVRRENEWAAFPYIWNDQQTEAFLRVAGGSKNISLNTANGDLDFIYFIPNENQCGGCHTTEHPDGEMHPLGAIAKQLNSTLEIEGLATSNQIELLQDRGWLAETIQNDPVVSYLDAEAPLEERASAYLDIHCGHCHNPEGAADTSALILDGSQELAVNMGVCKPPVAAGGGAGNLLYSIVPGAPEQSILLYRMRSVEPDEMMPELGRSLVHSEGIELISRWIEEMPGSCSQ